jgi:hypothetical protein
VTWSCAAVLRGAAGSALRTLRLLTRGRLHVDRAQVGRRVETEQGAFTVFRATSCDGTVPGTVTLFVWFHLRGIAAGARWRRAAFERLSILNTPLFAGFAGYLVKLWMVDPASADYAGLYSWTTRADAERYGQYITSLLAPLSTPGSVGFSVSDQPLDLQVIG